MVDIQALAFVFIGKFRKINSFSMICLEYWEQGMD